MTEEAGPKVVEKPWGSEIWFAQTPLYAGKLLRIDAGGRLSLQYHERKDESSYVLSGRIAIERGRDAETMVRRELGAGEAWRNEPRVVHTMEALEDTVVLEVSTPEVDDVVRLADRYGRAGAGQAREG